MSEDGGGQYTLIAQALLTPRDAACCCPFTRKADAHRMTQHVRNRMRTKMFVLLLPTLVFVFGVTHPSIGRLHVLLVHWVLCPLVQHLEQVHSLARLQVRLRTRFVRSVDCKSCNKMHPKSDQFSPCWKYFGGSRQSGIHLALKSPHRDRIRGGGTCRHCMKRRERESTRLSAGIKLSITSHGRQTQSSWENKQSLELRSFYLQTEC